MLTFFSSAVTAIYKGTPRQTNQLYSSILLRSYDSRKETALEPNCTIWQAGRATSATALAFKPIQVGQSTFLDEGVGKYNPAPQALDEAVLNEWPGRDVGILVSIGTGKRPADADAQQHMWWESFVGGGMGDFAEARRRLVAKIEGCEETHKYMEHKHLIDRGVSLDNYYRLNVEVGVGEFGMNEWNRLADISTKTRLYLADVNVQGKNIEAAAKLARIHRSNERWLQTGDNSALRYSWEVDRPAPPAVFGAVELPAEDLPPQPNFAPQHPPPQPPAPQQSSGAPLLQLNLPQPQSYRRPSDGDKFIVQAPEPKDWEQRQQNRPNQQKYPPRLSSDSNRPPAPLGGHSSTPNLPLPQRLSSDRPRPPSNPTEPPPIPPKTPINAPAQPAQLQPPQPSLPSSLQGHHQHPQQQNPQQQQGPSPQKSNMTRPPGGISLTVLPYPDSDGPPGAPPVNWGRKPELGGGR